VLQVYGLTETTAICTMDDPNRVEVGSVGPSIPGIEMKLGDNDEIVVRGPNVFSKYWNRPEQTADAMQEGWFHTGDQGEVSAAGSWRIAGRIKNLIILGSGHKISPEPIESAIAKLLPETQQVVVVGNGRGYLSALVTGSVTSEKVQSALDAVNPELPHYKQAVSYTHLDVYKRQVYFHNSGPAAAQAYQKYWMAIANAVDAFRKKKNVFVILAATERLDARPANRISERLGAVPVLTSDEYNMYELVSILRACHMMASVSYTHLTCQCCQMSFPKLRQRAVVGMLVRRQVAKPHIFVRLGLYLARAVDPLAVAVQQHPHHHRGCIRGPPAPVFFVARSIDLPKIQGIDHVHQKACQMLFR